jgi:hypothetical protein
MLHVCHTMKIRKITLLIYSTVIIREITLLYLCSIRTLRNDTLLNLYCSVTIRNLKMRSCVVL